VWLKGTDISKIQNKLFVINDCLASPYDRATDSTFPLPSSSTALLLLISSLHRHLSQIKETISSRMVLVHVARPFLISFELNLFSTVFFN
jgi:hypothetical protein